MCSATKAYNKMFKLNSVSFAFVQNNSSITCCVTYNNAQYSVVFAEREQYNEGFVWVNRDNYYADYYSITNAQTQQVISGDDEELITDLCLQHKHVKGAFAAIFNYYKLLRS